LKPVLRLVGAVVVLVLVALKLDAHVRLVHPSSKNPLYWQNPGSISIVTQSAGSQDIEDGSHFTALRNAISAWNAVPGSNARLVENTNPLAQASTDWHSDDLHMVLFDEANRVLPVRLGHRGHHANLVFFERADLRRGHPVQRIGVPVHDLRCPRAL